MCVFPALFALYPTQERLNNVRALHYSNGIRAIPLWLAYTLVRLCICTYNLRCYHSDLCQRTSH